MKLPKLPQKFLYTLTFFLAGFVFFIVGYNTNEVDAQAEPPEPDYQCIGSPLADYMNTLIDGAGNLSNIRLLSPAFNMTNTRSHQIALEMIAEGARFEELDGIAGNSYNTTDGSGGIIPITSYVDSFMTGSGLNVYNKPVLITETGSVVGGVQDPNRPNDLPALKAELGKIQSSSKYIGAVLYAPFEGACGGWCQYNMSDSDIKEICGSCSKIGANSAQFYVSDEVKFYQHAGGLGMDFIVEIANADESTTDGVDMAHKYGLTPVIRVGYVDGAGPTAARYVEYLRELNQHLIDTGGGIAYAIAGPNEPQSECWAAPDCPNCSVGPGGAAGVTITFEGRIRSLFPQRNDKGNLVSGMPIENAVVALYQGDPRNDPGSQYGIIRKVDNSEDSTDKNGNFVARGLRLANRGSFENANYLFVWCDGPGPVDAWKLDLTDLTVERDYFVPCRSGRYTRSVDVPDTFDLSDVGEQLSCGFVEEHPPVIESDPGVLRKSEIAPGNNNPIKIVQKQVVQSWPTGNTGDRIDFGGVNLPYRVEEPPESGFPGRNEISDVGWAPDVVVNLAGDYNEVEKHPLRSTDDTTDAAPKLQTCEEIRCSNRIIADDECKAIGDRNTHINYSIAAKASHPGTWAVLYPKTYGANPDVCVDSGGLVSFREIEPPFEQDLNDGPYEYNKEYFPYLFLLGDPLKGTESNNFQQSINDSFEAEEGTGAPTYTQEREERLSSRFFETSMKVWSETEIQASYDPSFSRQVKDVLVSEREAGDSVGENKGLAGVLSDSGTPYSTGNPDVLHSGNDDIVKVGRGDYQIGRTYNLCSNNYYDGGGEAYFNEDICNDPRKEDHPWCSGFKYLSPDGAATDLADLLKNIACAIDIFGLLAFFGTECIDPDPYDVEGLPREIFWTQFLGPNRDNYTLDGDGYVFGECVSWVEGAVDDCYCEESDVAKCNQDPNDPNVNLIPQVCKRTPDPIPRCTTSCEGGEFCEPYQCDGGYTPPDPDAPPKCCPWTDWRFTWERAHYTCLGDMYALFQGENFAWEHAGFNRNDYSGVAQLAEAYNTPGDTHRQCGQLTLTNYEVTDQEYVDRDTRAFNSGAIAGCTEYTLGRLAMSVADHVPEASGAAITPRSWPAGGGGQGGGGGGGGSRQCTVPYSGLCSPDSILAADPRFSRDAAEDAAGICYVESGGSATVVNDGCLIGRTYDYSVGLFQINLVPFYNRDADGNIIELLENNRCPGAFNLDLDEVQPPFCEVIDQDVLDECVARLSDPVNNVQLAFEISGGGTSWCAWAASGPGYCNLCSN